MVRLFMRTSSCNGSSVTAYDDGEGERKRRSSFSCNFQAIASLRCLSPSLKASDVISSIDFSENGKLFATGGIARKIRIYSYEALLLSRTADVVQGLNWEDENLKLSNRKSGKINSNLQTGEAFDHDNHAQAILCTPAKLSSLKWKPGYPCIIGSGDYDGTVAEWDVEHGCTVREVHEHNGQRVYSVDYSVGSPSLIAASASGDGTAKLWSLNTDKSVGIIKSPAGKSVCCAEFQKSGSNFIAIACADSKAYVYDLRNITLPYLTLTSHTRAASYVRWMATSKLFTASTDSSLKLWNMPDANKGWIRHRISENCSDTQTCHPGRTYNSHKNCKNFVGLSVNEDARLLACGSETNEVFVYHQDDSNPLVKINFLTSADTFEEYNSRSNSFVSSVCWKNHGDHYSLTAANSDGIVQVFRAQVGT